MSNVCNLKKNPALSHIIDSLNEFVKFCQVSCSMMFSSYYMFVNLHNKLDFIKVFKSVDSEHLASKLCSKISTRKNRNLYKAESTPINQLAFFVCLLFTISGYFVLSLQWFCVMALLSPALILSQGSMIF